MQVRILGAHQGQSVNTPQSTHQLKRQFKDFSHVVRDYRNFIHPNKERQEGITFDAGTCKVVWEVVSASLEN